METATLLLVEDETIIALNERAVLERSGYSVVAAYDGAAAVDAVYANPGIDLVLMDIDLGAGIDGTEAATRMLRHRDLPVVFLTSHAEKQMVDRLRGITRYGYILKDSGEFVLLQAIEMAFELFAARRSSETQRSRLQTTLSNLDKTVTEQRLAADALRVSESRLRAVFQSTDDAIYVKDASRRFQDVNPAVEWILGRPESQIVGRTSAELLDLSEAAHSELVDRQVLSGQTVAYEDCLFVDGEMRVFDVKASPVRGVLRAECRRPETSRAGAYQPLRREGLPDGGTQPSGEEQPGHGVVSDQPQERIPRRGRRPERRA